MWVRTSTSNPDRRVYLGIKHLWWAVCLLAAVLGIAALLISNATPTAKLGGTGGVILSSFILASSTEWWQ